MKQFVWMACLSALVLGVGAASPVPEKPKSTPLARVKVLSSNDLGITISHSKWGRDTAFKAADAHCGAVGKSSVYAGGTRDGTGTISTWRCL